MLGEPSNSISKPTAILPFPFAQNVTVYVLPLNTSGLAQAEAPPSTLIECPLGLNDSFEYVTSVALVASKFARDPSSNKSSNAMRALLLRPPVYDRHPFSDSRHSML